MKYQWALVGLLIATTCSTADVLSLQECMDLAMQNNLQHQMDQQTLASNRTQLTAARAPFAFNMNANITFGSSALTRVQEEAIATAVSAVNRCRY